MLLLLLLAFSATASVAVATTGAAGSSCTRSCGNVSIPYPFGVETGCYHTGGFNLACITRGHGPPKLFLGDGTVQVLEISAEHSTVRINSTSEVPFDDSGRTTSRAWGLGIPESGPYFLSESTNILKAIGCNIQVSILGGVNKSLLVSSCSAICPVLTPDSGFMGNGSCTGIGCCQVSIVLGYPRYTIQTKWLSEFQGLPLGAVYISDRSFDYTSDMMFGIGPKAFPATLDWIINNSTCPANETIAPECRSAHSYCQDSSSAVHEGYLCRCSKGYEGNPYVTGGCQDIDECKNSSKSYPCYGDCKNTPGSYVCLCHNGFKGNASVPNGCQGINVSYDETRSD
nr:unnamed protein product [Digitaria exilis]